MDRLLAHPRTGTLGARLLPVAVMVAAIGVLLMHGVGDPSVGHAPAPAIMSMAQSAHHAAPSHHDDPPCDHGDCRSHSGDMAMIGCAFAVLAGRVRPRRVVPPFLRSTVRRLPVPAGLRRGPEPPVPRFV